MIEILAPLNHVDTQLCVEAERAFSRALAGSCTVPLGAYALCDGGHINMTGFVASVDGKQMLRETASGSTTNADAVGRALADKLIARGADKILAAARSHQMMKANANRYWHCHYTTCRPS